MIGCWSPGSASLCAATAVAAARYAPPRLVDPATKGDRPGLGACTGDSGAPVFAEAGGGIAVLGVVNWSTGPALADGCGGLTGTTPLGRYRDWIVGTIGKLDASAR